jgi:hypothetical protein
MVRNINTTGSLQGEIRYRYTPKDIFRGLTKTAHQCGVVLVAGYVNC